MTDGVSMITLNRPDSLNAMNGTMRRELLAAVTAAGRDETVRAVIITGAGRGFCSGADLRGGPQEREFRRVIGDEYNPLITAIRKLPKPVIAAVNGVAAGAGASLAFAADFRVVVDSAGFNTSFAGVALSCDTGSSWTLPRLVGRATAMELLYFPRTVSAQEALELGLATQVVTADELPQAVGQLAARLASGPTVAFGSMRQAVAYASAHPLVESLAFEADKMALTGGTEDHLAAVDAFMAKEKPVFRGR
jgi:2-(1,2-epoxy-1,2-dihydrophenyl)acetyl-CoA isomerase